MIPRFRTTLRWSEIARLAFESSGAEKDMTALASLEKEFARRYSLSHAVLFPYARVAIRAFLETAPEGSAQKCRGAVLSAFNCVALGNAIVSSDWEPIYVDTEADGFNQDTAEFLETLERKDASVGIPVAEWGIRPSDEIHRLAKKPLLYDFAMSGMDPKPPLLRDQDAVVYSMGWGKPLGGIRGAFLAGNSIRAAERWRAWRDTLLKRTPALNLATAFEASVLKLAFEPRLFRATVGLQSMPLAKKLRGKPNGSILPSDWDRLPRGAVLEMIRRRLADGAAASSVRSEQIRAYREKLSPLMQAGLSLPGKCESLSHFPIRIAERDALRLHLFSKGIFSSSELFSVLLLDYPWLVGSSDKPREFPKARHLTRTTLHLPLYPGLDLATQSRIVDEVRLGIGGVRK